jgi:putative ATPase
MVVDVCYSTSEQVEMSKYRINLAKAAIFCALAPKSNSVYLAIEDAISHIRQYGREGVPTWLKDGHGLAPRQLGHGVEDLYRHSFEVNITGQEYILTAKKFYVPNEVGAERVLGERYREIAKFAKKLRNE